ncbi:EpaQ family protein [Enterococcus sp. BWM-S5]|uniref:EpaQ family protein n=1 Tax=Enterococcus larvae TaxID=2794352 RepID=A0ABS4CFI5_9ENTE|nr:EpaQ family protein [Enterococcus larvae]MBP1045306.1 EpaQ family protein [Enterococcus larvae]
MGNVTNRVSNFILLILVAGSYWLWAAGITGPYTKFVFENAIYICLAAAIFLLAIRYKQLTKSDLGIILLSFFSFLFYFFTTASPIPWIPLILPTLLLLILCFKKTLFDNFDYLMLLGISIVSMVSILYRICIVQSLGQSYWINTNTLGTALLFSTITAVILLKSFKIGFVKYVLIALVYVANFIGIWIVTSETALIVLTLFCIIDTLIPKKLIQSIKINIFSIALSLLFIIVPFIMHYIATTNTLRIFSGREQLWGEFFKDWLSTPKNILIGKEPFYSSILGKNLGIHNSFLYVLATYGLLGYALLFGSIIGYVLVFWRSKISRSKKDISFLLAFLCICIHATMEQTLTSASWFPLVYLFLGLTISDQKPTEKQTRSSRNA